MTSVLHATRVPVSVVIPCYRCADVISAAVASVSAQTALPEELILVEDCSGDEGQTLTTLQSLREEYREVLRIEILVQQENRGPGEARNAGWEIANQEFVAFLDADDTWHPQKLAIQTKWMLDHPDYILTSHETVIYQGTMELFRLDAAPEVKDVGMARMLFRNEFATRSVMVRRSVMLRFSTGVRRAEDYDLWMRIMLAHGGCAKLFLPLAYSYKSDYGASGLSGNLSEMHRSVLECFAHLRDDGNISFFQYVMAYAVEKLKYLKRRLMM